MADPGRRPDDDATPGREQTPAEPGTAAPEAADRDAATPATPSEQASAPAASQAPIGPDEPVVPGAPAPVEVPDRTVEPVPAEPAPVEPVPAKPVPAEPAPGEPDRPAPHIAPAPPDAAGATVPIAPVPGAAMAAAVTESATHAEPDEGTRAAEDERAEPARPRRRSWLPIALLALLAIVAVAGTAYLAIRVREHQRTEDARAEALEASREAAQLLFSYNHETLQEDFEAGLATTTGEFREEYQQTTAEVVTPVATEYDAVVEAEVAEAGVVSASPEHVVTIVYLNQATTSTRVEGQKIDQSRVRMHMRLVDGEWLVEQVDAL